MFGGNSDVAPLYNLRVLRLGQGPWPMPSFAGSARARSIAAKPFRTRYVHKWPIFLIKV